MELLDEKSAVLARSLAATINQHGRSNHTEAEQGKRAGLRNNVDREHTRRDDVVVVKVCVAYFRGERVHRGRLENEALAIQGRSSGGQAELNGRNVVAAGHNIRLRIRRRTEITPQSHVIRSGAVGYVKQRTIPDPLILVGQCKVLGLARNAHKWSQGVWQLEPVGVPRRSIAREGQIHVEAYHGARSPIRRTAK